MVGYHYLAVAIGYLGAAALPLSAAETRPAATGPSPAAQRLLRQAAQKMKLLESVSADIHLDVDLLGCRFPATGIYRRQGSSQVRLEVTFTVQGTGEPLFDHQLLEVSDGKTWWRRIKMPGRQECHKIDVTQVQQSLDRIKVEAAARELFVLRRFGFGALFALVDGLDHFAELTIDPATTEAQWVLSGQVTGEISAQIRQAYQDKKGRWRVPPEVPQFCKLVIDKQTWWPVQIELTSLPDPTPQRKEPYRIVLTYSNVRLNQPIPPETFALTPAKDEPVADMTQAVLEDIAGLARRQAQQGLAPPGPFGPEPTGPDQPAAQPEAQSR